MDRLEQDLSYPSSSAASDSATASATATEPTRVSTLHLEQHALGELPSRRAAVVAQYAQTLEGAARLAAISDSDRATLCAHPPRVMAAAITMRAEQLSRQRRAQTRHRALLLSAATALAALLIVVSVWLGRAAPDPSGLRDLDGQSATAGADPKDFDRGGVAEVVRLKGLTPHLLIHRKAISGDAPSPLAEGATVSAGDTLQVSYVAADAPYGAVLSIDGRGAVTLHFPSNAEASTALTQGGAVPLPHAYRLDDAPTFERFIFITSPLPLDVPQLLQAADALAHAPDARDGGLSLPSDIQQRGLLLLK